MATTDQLLNTLFDKRYRIMRKLGSGGMANVYLAEDQELGRRVAIKILNERHAGDEQFIERFRREAKNAAGLSHQNIVSIYDRGEAEGTYYIAMEYLDGRSLKELILSRGPAPVSVAVDYARQILSALRFAHRNGIVHRDIKPHNVLVDAEGHVKVTDFGIARAGASQMTEEGSIIGTAQYLSPEQARGTTVDQTSDLYSLGIVLYEMLTGEVPFTGDSPVEIAMKHLSATPPPLREKRPDVPKALELVVLRALAKDPAQRYQSAEEMDADLERVARGLGVSRETEEAATTVLRGAAYVDGAGTTVLPALATADTRAPVGPPRGPDYFDYAPPPRRRSIWPWLLAILLVAAAVVAGFYVYRQIQDQLDQNKPVGVPYVVGLREASAVDDIHAVGLEVDEGLRLQPDAERRRPRR
jgi:serine/threonine-protein kinase